VDGAREALAVTGLPCKKQSKTTRSAQRLMGKPLKRLPKETNAFYAQTVCRCDRQQRILDQMLTDTNIHLHLSPFHSGGFIRNMHFLKPTFRSKMPRKVVLGPAWREESNGTNHNCVRPIVIGISGKNINQCPHLYIYIYSAIENYERNAWL
jgi:hypothetical protein